jgi:predicted MFS family arabinose efflux permease
MLLLVPTLGLGVPLFLSFLVASLAFAFRQGPVQALATELVPAHARGALVAMRTTASQTGIAVSTAVSGWLFDHHGYWSVGIFCSAVTLVAAGCIAVMKEPGTRDQKSEVRSQKSEIRDQRSEVRGRQSDGSDL